MTQQERLKKLESFGKAADLVWESLKQFPRNMWQYRPGPDRWTIHEILIHLADSEVHAYARCRKIIAEPGTQVMAWSQDTWAKELNYHTQDPETSLELFRLLRKSSYDLLKAVPEAVWQSHSVIHPEYGPQTLDRWLEIYEHHGEAHVNQMKKNLEAWQKSGGK
jgi:hypothetical protein